MLEEQVVPAVIFSGGKRNEVKMNIVVSSYSQVWFLVLFGNFWTPLYTPLFFHFILIILMQKYSLESNADRAKHL